MYKPTLLQVFEKNKVLNPFQESGTFVKLKLCTNFFFQFVANFQWWQPKERVHNGWWGRLNSKRGFEALECQKSGHV
jgi:hypothetical protein